MNSATAKWENLLKKIKALRKATTKGKDYYRGVWYVNGKKKQKYLGSEDKIHQMVKKKFRGFESLTYNEKSEKVLEFFLPQFQLDFWSKEYEDFKS